MNKVTIPHGQLLYMQDAIATLTGRVDELEDYIRRGYQQSKTKQMESDYLDEGIALLKGESR